MHRLSLKTLLIIFFFLLISVVVLWKFVLPHQKVSAAWWNDSWNYRQAINISSHNTSESNVYIIATVSIGSTTKIQVDGGDFRFVTQSGNLLPYYVSSGTGTTAITFHIQFSSFPSGAQTIYAYYGNSTVVNGFSGSDFSTEASNYSIGSYSTEEAGGGPVAYWKFNEGTGTTIYDSSSNQNDGYFGGVPPTWSSEENCINEKCLDFSSATINIPNKNTLNFGTNNFTISVWAKFRDYTYPKNTFEIMKNLCNLSVGSTGFSIGHTYNSNGANICISDGVNRVDSNISFNNGYKPTDTLNKWTYFNYVFDRSAGKVIVYVNGVKQNNELDISSVTGSINNSNDIIVGDVWGWKMDGLVDELKIYPYARSAAQIKLDYNSRGSKKGSSVNLGVKSNTAPSLKSKLFAYYKFDNNLNDSISVGKTAITLDNVFGYYNSNGKNGQGLDFTVKESGSFIYVDNNTLRDSTKNWTTNQWAGYQFAMYYTGTQWCKDTINSNTSTDIVFSSTCNSFAGSKIYLIKKSLYVSLPLSGHSTNAISASLWFKSNGSQSSRRLARMTNEAFNISLNGTSVSTGINSYSSQISYTSTPNDQKWHQITMTYDGSIEKLYYDSVMVGTYSTAVSINSGGDLTLAARNDGVDEFFNGLIDEVKIYNTALTDEEIKQDYNQNSAALFGSTNQTIGGTTTNLEYCIPGDTSYCANPVAEWKMDERVGTTAFDTSGNNNTGIFGAGNSAPTWTTGKIGAGLNFDGTNDYLKTISSTTLPTDITISMWINPTSWTNQTHISLISSRTGADGLMFFILSQGNLNFDWGSNQDRWDTGYQPPLNTWTHLTISRNSSGRYFYVNGQLKNSTVSAGTTSTNSKTINLGSDDSTGTNQYFFQGKIDQVKIYPYARTPAQIAYDYNKGGPTIWLKLDECQGLTAFDSSGSGYTGSINIGTSGSQNSLGTCAVGTSAAWTAGASGKINSSLNLDGTDDYIRFPLTAIGITQPFTISAWFKTSVSFGYSPGIVSLGYIPVIVMQTNGTLRAWWYDGVTYPGINTTKSYNDSIWHLATLTYDSTTVKLYVDGIYIGQNTSTVQALWDYFEIGMEKNNGYKIFNGQIDDARFYRYALTPDQIKTIYNNGAVNFN